MRLAPLFAVAALLLPASSLAFDVGPAVGAKIPALHVKDVQGRSVDLKTISGKKGVVLLFFRSAKWCPFCQKQLLDFREAQAPLEARGYRLAAISYDPSDIQQHFAEAHQVGYQFLSDQGSVTIDAFGLRDPQYAPGSFAYGVPRPSIFIVSPAGVIEAKLAEEGFKVRPSVQAVIDAVDKLKR